MGERRAGARRSVAEPKALAGRPALRLVRGGPVTVRARAAAARTDLRLLIGAVLFLTMLGLVMVLSAGSVSAAQGYDGNSFWYFQRQIVYAVVGLAAMVLIWRMPYRAWRRLCLPLLLVSGVAMVIAVAHPSRTCLYGACRWIDLGPVTLQPSEFAKLALVAFAATVLSRKWRLIGDAGHLLIPLVPVTVVVVILVLLQQDLGTAVILSGSVFLLAFVAGARAKHLVVGGIVGLAGVAALIFGTAYRRIRFFEAWLDPGADPKGDGYQLIQSLVAIGSGGWFGTGLGTSRAKWDFLPNAHSDFIFAVIAEELGMAGAIGVLLGFALLLFAGIRIALHADDLFGRLLAGGIVAWIGLQTVINLGAVTGLLPITGVPLPFLSFGGTALVATLAGVGVLASVARASAGPTRGRRAPGSPS